MDENIDQISNFFSLTITGKMLYCVRASFRSVEFSEGAKFCTVNNNSTLNFYEITKVIFSLEQKNFCLIIQKIPLTGNWTLERALFHTQQKIVKTMDNIRSHILKLMYKPLILSFSDRLQCSELGSWNLTSKYNWGKQCTYVCVK